MNTTNTVAPAAVTAERPGEIQSSDSTNQTAGELRVGLPVVGAVIGMSIKKGCPTSSASSSDNFNFCIDFGYLGEGLVTGMLVASALDAGLLSWEANYGANQNIKSLSLLIAPAFEPKTGTKGVSFSGRF